MKGKVGVLFLALMVGMAGIGASYALWSETITLTGTVSTGTVGIDWSTFTDNDDGLDPGLDYITGEPVVYTKDVADCTVTTTGNLVEVTITNAYPSYACTIDGDITNTGTIPVEVYLDYIDVPSWITVTPSGGFIGMTSTDPMQLHGSNDPTGGPNFVEGDFVIHIEQWEDEANGILSPQGETITFTIKAEGRQYNEPRP